MSGVEEASPAGPRAGAEALSLQLPAEPQRPARDHGGKSAGLNGVGDVREE